MTEHYVGNEAYNAAVNAIAAMTLIDPDDIKVALGEHGNIWPMSVRADAISATNGAHGQDLCSVCLLSNERI
jgi:hypothetical protein